MLLTALSLTSALAPIPGAPTYEVATCMLSPAREVAVDRLTDLLPKDAFAVVRARSIQTVIDDANQLTGRGPGDADHLTVEHLLEPLESSEVVSKVALDRPVGLALIFGQGSEPVVWAALPVNDAQGFITAIPEGHEGLYVFPAQDYVIVSSAEIAELPTGGFALPPAVADADIGAHVDLAALVSKFGPLIEMGLGQAEQAVASAETGEDGADVAPMMETYLDTVREFLASAQTLDLTLRSRERRIEGGMSFTIKDGSPMSKWYGGERRDLGRGAGLIDSNAALAMLSMCDPKHTSRKQLDMLDSLAEAVPDNLKDLVELEARAWREMLPLTGGLTAFNLDLGVDGLRGMTFVESSEPAKLAESITKILSSQELGDLGVEVEPLAAREVGGATWTEYQLRFDVESMVEHLGDDEALSTEELDEANQAIAAVLGEDGLRLGLTSSKGFLVARMGGDDAFATRALGRIGARPTGLGTGLQNALSSSRSVNAAWVAQFDLGRILGQVDDLASRFGESLELPLELVGESFPITLHSAVEGLNWRGGIELDAEDIARFVRAFEDQ